MTVAANSSASVSFAAFTLSAAYLRGTVRAGTDPLPQDNVFHFVLTPSRPVSVLVVAPREESGQRTDPTLFLSKALSIGTTPAFQIEVVSAARMTPANLDKRAVVILNDTPFPPAAAGGALKRFVEQGGGLLVVLGEHSTWPQNDAALLRGRSAASSIGWPRRRARLLDYSHPVFEVFKAPRSGDFSGTRVFRYRALTAPTGGRVLARFDDGAVAATEQRIGLGRVIAWNTTFDDSWSDLAKKPVFLPLVHQLTRYLARYEEPAAWRTVGQALDLTSGSILVGAKRDRVALTPSGRRLTLSTGSGPSSSNWMNRGSTSCGAPAPPRRGRPPSPSTWIRRNRICRPWIPRNSPPRSPGGRRPRPRRGRSPSRSRRRISSGGRRSGGICCLPASCCWQPKQSSRIGSRGCNLVLVPRHRIMDL